jgi:hypothetical protein
MKNNNLKQIEELLDRRDRLIYNSEEGIKNIINSWIKTDETNKDK